MPAGPARPLLLGLALVGATLALTVLCGEPPAPLPESAPGEAFSGRRAEAMSRYLLAEGEPHPLGSAPNARLQERLVRVLRQLGYETSVQDAFVCREGSCGRVHNVLARLPGGGTGKAVLLSCHYDSVGAGPGAGDDGVGVAAVLEAARALRQGPRPPRPVLLLIDEGEEDGLLGAQAFLDQHPAAKEVGAVVNLDARGTAGPSLMFETSGASGWLAAAVGRALRRPRTSSLFVTVYERLPNDTDLTAFREAGVPGVNFAFIRNVVHYHTPLDDLDHVDVGTLQHQGENALAMVRALAAAEAPLEAPPPGRAVFFDVLGRGVVRWPAAAALPLAAAAALLCALSLLGLGRAGRLGRRALLAGIGGALLAILGAALLGVVLAWALRASGAMPRAWVAHPAPAELCFWLAAVLSTSVAVLAAAPAAGAAGLWGGGAIVVAAAALASSALLPGVSHLFVVPALLGGLAGLGWSRRPASAPWAAAAAIVPAVAQGLVALPVAVSAYDAMGITLLPAVALLFALVLWPLSPLAGGAPRSGLRRGALAAAAAAVAALLLAAALPTASAEAPERLPLTYYAEVGATGADAGPRWLAFPETGALPAALRGSAAFGAGRESALPWTPGRRAFRAAAPPLGAPPPELEVLSERVEGDRRHVRVRLRSPRGAAIVSLHVLPTAGLGAIRLQGQPVPQRSGSRWPGVRCHTTPPQGIEAELTLPAASDAEVIVADQTPGLPPAGTGLVAARPPGAVTSHEGDVTILARRLRL